MKYTIKKSFTYRCDNLSDMDEALDEVIKNNAGFTVIKQEKKLKQKKSKGEVVDEYWLYTVTIDILDDNLN